MAANPRVDFLIANGNGNPTAANLNAVARGDVQLRVDPQHWLAVASGGDTNFSWRHVEMIVAASFFLEEPLTQLTLNEHALSLPQLALCFRAALDAGLPSVVKTCFDEAAFLFVAFCRAKRATAPAAFTISMIAQMHGLPAHTGAAVPPPAVWTNALQIRYAVDRDGDALRLAWIINLLPGRYTSEGRRSDDFVDAASELFDVALARIPNLAAQPNRRQAQAIAAFLTDVVPLSELLVAVPPHAAFFGVQLLRMPRNDAFHHRFLTAWPYPYPNLFAAFTNRCTSRDAFSYIARLVGHSPSDADVAAMNDRVGSILAALDTADLRGPDVPPIRRVGEIERILSSSSRRRPTDADRATTTSSASEHTETEWAKVFALDPVRALVAAIEPLDVTPLVPYRAVRELLVQPNPLGVLFLSGAKVNHPLFKRLTTCREPTNVSEAFRRRLCVDPAGRLRVEWFPLIAESLPTSLIKGTFATAESLSFNLWADLASPLIKANKGEHFVLNQPDNPDAAAAADPSAFFTSDFMLRHGSAIVTAAFAFIGVDGHAAGSIASVLSTLREKAEEANSLPDTFATGRAAAIALLRRAGCRAFADFAARWRSMLLESPLRAARPTPFAPDGSGVIGLLASAEEIMDPIRKDIHLATLGAPSRAASLQLPSSPSSSTQSVVTLANLQGAASVVSSVGPSTSQIHGQPPSAGVAASHVGSNTSASAAKGSKVPLLQRQGRGVWFPVSNGTLLWCSAKGTSLFDLDRCCAGALAPNGHRPSDYCTGGASCTHQLTPGFTVVRSRIALVDDDLRVSNTGPIRRHGGRESDSRGRGKGSPRGRGRGRARGN